MGWNLPTAAELDAERRGKPLTKPSQVERIAKKQARKAEVSKAKGKALRTDRARLSAIREACYERDKGRCRACGLVVQLRDSNPFLVAECDHLKPRSQGGSDELENRATLCLNCHHAKHQALLQITGDPNDTLSFTEYDATSGRTVRTWESGVPQ